MSIRITENFTVDEMQCKCGCGACNMDMDFMLMLQRMRTARGKAMKIISPYRCPEWNAKVGGAPDSYHMKGRAADIYAPNGKEMFILLELAVENGFSGIGIGKNFIHVDNREIESCWPY